MRRGEDAQLPSRVFLRSGLKQGFDPFGSAIFPYASSNKLRVPQS